MKTLITKHGKLITLFLAFIASISVVTIANADARNIAYFPVATCHTAAIDSPLPPYICCEKLVHTRHGVHHAWRNTWVSGSCKNADVRARGDMGCTMESPVFTTGKPIVGVCFYSFSTGKFE